MKIVQAESVLGDLKLTPLRALIPDREPYLLALLQPDGPIEATRTRIGHKDQARGRSLLFKFLREANRDAAAIAVTPEYSTPWEVVAEIATDTAIQPPNGSIWILGCESLAVELLATAVSELRGLGCFVHHEALDALQHSGMRYFDPVVYVFWTRDGADKPLLSMIIQFKTEACHDSLDIELTSLCKGSTVYCFNRGVNTLALMCFICSDAFVFTDELVNEYYRNILLIHIQLNPKPAHLDYSRYRQRLLSIGTESDMELLCLNWAANIEEWESDTEQKRWKNNSGSAFYVPPKKFKAAEEQLNTLHRAGLYYGQIRKWHGIFLNQEPHAVILKKEKALVIAVPHVLSPTYCVEFVRRWTWTQDLKVFIADSPANDGFASTLAAYGSIREQLERLRDTSPMSVERALEMLSGAIVNPVNWHHIDKLTTLQIGPNDSLHRMTVAQDLDPDSSGNQLRRARLQSANAAVAIPKAAISWPFVLRDLSDGFTIHWESVEPNRNVRSLTSGQSAAIAYLGDAGDVQRAEAVLLSITKAAANDLLKGEILQSADTTEQFLINCKDRAAVIFRSGLDFEVHGHAARNRIDTPPTAQLADIAAESHD